MEATIAPADVVHGLLRPEAYPHRADRIELKETHGSWVVLAGPYAYKLKKPVNLGFFDFSTPARRAADAEAELRLNRRLAPSTYLGVVDVVQRDGQIFVGGPGQPLERAVRMRRLPDDGMLSALLRQDAATPRLVRRVARIVARFHATAATGVGVDEHGGCSNLEANWRENFEQVRPFVGSVLEANALDKIERYVWRTLQEKRELIERRVAEGRIRDGHGDLHAGSICLHDRRIVIFDCIEFSARYRCADVAAEVAFLAMDLDHAGRADLGWAFVDEYVARSGDPALVELLSFYKCYRAFVRGKVQSMRLDQGNLGEDDRGAMFAQARGYFDLATTYTAELAHPSLVVLSGLPASGKTTLARDVASRLGFVLLSTDVIRKQRAGLKSTDRAVAAFGAGLYQPAVTRRTYAALRRYAARWLRRGVSVVLDGTFGSPSERKLARRLAHRYDAAFLVAFTECEEATTRARLEARQSDTMNVSDASWEIYEQLRQTFVPPDEIPDAELIVDRTGGTGADAVIARVSSR